MADQGIFWSMHQNESAICDMLASQEYDLEYYLELEDFLQELRANTLPLVNFVSKTESLDKLVSLITEMPPEDAPNSRAFKLPYIANEAICLGVDGVMCAFFDPKEENRCILHKFWCFVNQPKPLNPVLAGYFSRSAITLFTSKQNLCCKYLKENNFIIDKLMYHCYSKSITELLKTILCSNLIRLDGPQGFDLKDVVSRLLKSIQVDGEENDNRYDERAENIVLILHNFLDCRKDYPDNSVLLNELVFADNMALLIEYLCSNRLTSVTAAVRIFALFITFSCTDNFSIEWLNACSKLFFCNSANQRRPMADIAAGKQENTSAENEDDSSMISDFVRKAEFLDLYLAPQLHRLRPYFKVETTNPTTPPSVGLMTLEILKLIEAMLLSNSEKIADSILHAGLLEDIVNLFFTYSWNSILHLHFCKIFHLFLYRSSVEGSTLFEEVMRSTSFLINAVTCLRKRKHIRESKSIEIQRKMPVLLGGNSSQIIALCNVINVCKKLFPSIGTFLQNTTVWNMVVEPELECVARLLRKYRLTAINMPYMSEGDFSGLMNEEGYAMDIRQMET